MGKDSRGCRSNQGNPGCLREVGETNASQGVTSSAKRGHERKRFRKFDCQKQKQA